MLNRPLAGTTGLFRLVAILLPLLICACAMGQVGTDDEEAGSGSRRFRIQALQLVPVQQLNQPTREKLDDVLQHPSLYRRLPISTIAVDSDYFRLLVRYPEVIVNIWQLMGVTQMSTERTGPFTIDTDDGAGTISNLELIYGNDNLHIFYGTGTYEGPVIRKKLTGRCVLILKTEYSVDSTGHPLATNQLDVFLKVDNATLGLITKTIAPIVGSTADNNFTESLKFVQRLNETTENNGPGVQAMGTRLNIDDDVKQKFVEAAGVVYERALTVPHVENALNKPVVVPTAATQSSYETESDSYPTSFRAATPYSDERNYLPQYQPQPANSLPTPPPIVLPQSSHRSNMPVYNRLSDQRNSGLPVSNQRITARPTGYQSPVYDPIKRY